MHTVIRTYSGKGAAETIDLIIDHKRNIKKIMRSIKGFINYTVVKTDAGGFTVTLSKNKKSADAITRAAREWVEANAAHLEVNPPIVDGGKVVINIDAD